MRNPDKLGDLAGRVDVVRAALNDAEALSSSLVGIDAVASCVGPAKNDPAMPALFRAYLQALTEAMRARSVKRVVAIAGTSSALPGARWPWYRRAFAGALKLAAGHMLAAHQAQIDVLRESSVEWVVARCPDMTSKPPRGGVIALEDTYPGFRVTRADLAAFLLDQLSDDTWLRRAPIVASP